VKRLPVLAQRWGEGQAAAAARDRRHDVLVPAAWRKAVYANAVLPTGRWIATRTWCAGW
jgi:hypothetical protein